MNPSCRATKVSWTLEPNNSVTRQRCSWLSSKPGWTNWVKSLVQRSFDFGVTDDNRWKTSNSRSLCSRFKRVAYPERILIATYTLSLEDNAYLIMCTKMKENRTRSLEQARHLTLYQTLILLEAWNDILGQVWVLGHPGTHQSLPKPVTPETPASHWR